MQRIGVKAFVAALSFASVGAGAAVSSAVVDLALPSGALRYLDTRPDNPYATLIAFAGGQGYMGIQSDGTFTTIEGTCSPVGRNRQALAEHGYAVVLVDNVLSASAPNMQALISHLHGRADVPVWIVGMSSSTELAAELAANLPAVPPLGAAFLSPIRLDPALLATIRRPSLVLINASDTDQSGSQVYAALTEVPAKKLTVLAGGTKGACNGLGYHVFYGIEAAFVDAVTTFVDSYNDTLTPQTAALDLNQHGLTGSWYEPVTSGQGVEVEIFPSQIGPGIGFTQVSWFTYDTASGGADHQRWYTLSGNVVSGQRSAALTIYRNTGGNFNAAPATAAQPMGSATLSFDSCTSGQLDYNFSDAPARSGSIPLTRLAQNMTCVATGTPLTHGDYSLSGNWFDPATSGQGITVEVNLASRVLFFAWYTYANNGASAGAAGQRWYTGQAGYTAGLRSIPFTLYETTGGVFAAPTTPAPGNVPVGTGTLDFQSCANATLAFNFNGGSSSGRSGSIALVRIGPVPAGCTS